MIVDLLIHLYSILLRFYPGDFRSEFGDEMREVFRQQVEAARHEGVFAFGQICLKELIGLPASIAHVHSQNGPGRGAPPVQNKPIDQPWKELLIALVVFMLPAAMILANRPPQEFSTIGLSAGLLFLVVMLVIGWLGGFPLWSLPYVGVVLAISAYLYIFQWVADLVSPTLITNFSSGPWERSSYLVLEVASYGMLWLMLFCLTLLVVALLQISHRFQSLMARIRHDWTLISFILYGESIFALVLLLEDYRHDPNYVIASLFCLLAGVWLYLRSSASRVRVLALLSCLTLAVGITVSNKWQLASTQEGSALSPLRPAEIVAVLLTWSSMIAALLLPGLLARLPSPPARSAPSGPPEAG